MLSVCRYVLGRCCSFVPYLAIFCYFTFPGFLFTLGFVISRKIHKAIEEISTSSFFCSVLSTFEQGLQLLGNVTVQEILCYGLGHIAECAGARYQLALLLSLKKHFSATVLVYDPRFYAAETDILEELGCEIIKTNEEGKRKLKHGVTTLVYLPHCPKQLTNNLLWANWGPQLKHCILFSNSFAKIIETEPDRVLNNTAGYILHVSPYTTELPLTNLSEYKNIFYASSIHIFPQSKLDSVSETFWNIHEEPKYNIEDREFIVNKLSDIKLEA